jgi:putative acetyltransferase
MRSVNKANRCEVRRLQLADVPELLEIIRSARAEYGLAERVPALLEPTDYRLLDHYRRKRSAYFVARVAGEVAGGAGIYPLINGDWTTCELQRMYLRSAYRGGGIGQTLLDACLQTARDLGFEHCYAETISEMSSAIRFYERNGFTRCLQPIGDTGHGHNDCWLMLKLRGRAARPLQLN